MKGDFKMKDEKKELQVDVMELFQALQQLVDVVQNEFNELKKELENE